MDAANGSSLSKHHSVINRYAVKALLDSEGLRCSEDLILTLEARIHVMIRQGIRGMGGLSSKTVRGEHIERGAMRADPSAVASSKGKKDQTAPRKVRRGLLS